MVFYGEKMKKSFFGLVVAGATLALVISFTSLAGATYDVAYKTRQWGNLQSTVINKFSNNSTQSNKTIFIVKKEDPNDPQIVKKRFLDKINRDIKVAAPLLEKPRVIGFMQRAFKYTKKYEYNINQTTSIVSPYRGNVIWTFILKTKDFRYKDGHGPYGDNNPIVFKMEGIYAYQDNVWVMKNLRPPEPPYEWAEESFTNMLKSAFPDLR